MCDSHKKSRKEMAPNPSLENPPKRLRKSLKKEKQDPQVNHKGAQG
jgi:hypothetical protein